MARAKLPNGRIERGHANQRHFARQAQRLDGVNIVCSYTTGGISLSVDDGADFSSLVALASEYGGTLSFEQDMNGTGQYSSGKAALAIEW